MINNKLNKFIASFDCVDQFLIFLLPAKGHVSITSFASSTGAPAGRTSARVSLIFLFGDEIVKKLI